MGFFLDVICQRPLSGGRCQTQARHAVKDCTMEGKILIVGAGPVGLTMAIQLARYGVAVDIIDRGTGGSSYSKALSVSAASLKAMHGLGLSKAIHLVGKPIRDIQIFFNTRRSARIDKR